MKNENVDEEKRWINSIQIPLTKNQNQNQQPTITPVLQLVGLKSSTRTIFARIQHTTIRLPHNNNNNNNNNNNKIDDDDDDDEDSHHRCCCFRVEDVLDNVMERIRNDNDNDGDNDNDNDNESVQEQEQEAIPSTRTLLELGSVWVLNPSNVDRPQNKPSWKRLLLLTNNSSIDDEQQQQQQNQQQQQQQQQNQQQSEEEKMTSTCSQSSQESSLLLVDETMILRIHSRPSRFPVVKHFRLTLQQHLVQNKNKKNNENNNSNNKSDGDCGDVDNGGVIIYESNSQNHNHNHSNGCRDNCCFTILNKPCGLPSHATVDNGTENVLYQYQQYQRQISIDSSSSSRSSSSSSKKPNDYYASLPQRLDTETSGLLIISTSSQFASYICKLLEQKTLAIPLTIPPTMISSTSTSTSTSTNIPVVQKRYKCLVGFNTKEIWDTIKTNYQICGRIVEHCVDVNSKAPKTFVTPGAVTTTTAPPNDTSTTTTTTSKWLSCRLRILTITPPINTSSISRPSTSSSTTTPTTTTSTSTSINVISKFGFVVYKYVAELEIELLTGRTHQIRGQLAALGCPIIGDPLYGGSGSVSGNDSNGIHHQLSLLQQSRGTTYNSTVTNKMALQCCQLTFTFDNDNINDKKKKEKNTSKKKKKLLSNKAIGNATATATTNGSARSRDERMTIQIHQEECSSNNSSNSRNNLFHFRLDSAWWSDDIACFR